MTTRSPSFRPRDASMALLVACSLLGSTALEMEQDRGAASKSICLISLAVAAASAISRGMSTGSGTTSAGICPLSFYHRDKEKKIFSSYVLGALENHLRLLMQGLKVRHSHLFTQIFSMNSSAVPGTILGAKDTTVME